MGHIFRFEAAADAGRSHNLCNTQLYVNSLRRFILQSAIAVFLAAGGAGPAAAADLAGPVEAAVLRVIDGDTIEVAAAIWLDQVVTVRVRLRGADAPELGGARCEPERALAIRARDRLAALAGARVTLTEIGRDKYAGRVDATVTGPDGSDLAARLVAEGLARAYEGGRRAGWCD